MGGDFDAEIAAWLRWHVRMSCPDARSRGKRRAKLVVLFVVSPIFFKGGNIGELAVNGTVNDVAMCGAMPKRVPDSRKQRVRLMRRLHVVVAAAALFAGLTPLAVAFQTVKEGEKIGIKVGLSYTSTAAAKANLQAEAASLSHR